MRVKKWLMVLVLFALVGSSFALTISWNGSQTDKSWGIAENWGGGVLPGALDQARNIIATSVPIVNSTVPTVTSVNIFNASGPSVSIVDGGSLTVTTFFGLGQNISTFGTLDMSGGTLTVVTGLRVGTNGTGTINMSGGTITCGSLSVPTSAGSGVVNLSGGSIITDDLLMSVNGRINIQNTGSILIHGNSLTEVQGYITSGWITNARTYLAGENTMITLVPEPATIALLGLSGLVLLRKKRDN